MHFPKLVIKKTLKYVHYIHANALKVLQTLFSTRIKGTCASFSFKTNTNLESNKSRSIMNGAHTSVIIILGDSAVTENLV